MALCEIPLFGGNSGRGRGVRLRAAGLQIRGAELAAVPSIGRAADVELGAQAADSLALQGLYERHSHSVFRFCLSYLRNRDEAEDAAQTTFLYALRALRRGVVPSSEAAWLLKIARNVCLSRFDSVRRRGNLELIQDPSVLAETAAAPPGVDFDLMGLQAALEQLPQRQRQAILLREWQGLSYAEIGEELGLTVSAVETLLFRARRSLARELGADEARRGLDLGSLLGWAKAFFGSISAKLAVGAAVVATVGVVAPAAVHRFHSNRAPAPEPAQAPAPSAAQPAVGAPTASASARRPSWSSLPVAPAAAPRGSSAPASGPAQAAPPPEPAPTHGSGDPSAAPPAPPAASADSSVPAPAAALPVAAPSLPAPVPTATVPTATVPTVPDLPAPVPPLPALPAPPPPPDLPAPPSLP